MEKITISQTGLTVSKNGFGALPIQRIPVDDAARLVRRAFDSGITYFDSARAYSDSEIKLGQAFDGVRDRVIIATKTMGGTVEIFWQQLAQSLENLRTDYIDFYQFHNPSVVPKPGDGSGHYEAMLEAKAQGKIRHIGITNHRLPVAIEAMESGLYEIIQYPFNYLSSDSEVAFVRECERRHITVVAMKALSGGLITNSAAAYAYLRDFPNVLPIWGIQRENELDEFLSYHDAPPSVDGAILATIERDKKDLGGNFCRGCGYCMPCPAGIEIPTMARMSLLLRRSPNANFLSDGFAANMENIENCKHCRQCTSQCPYSLDTPRLLRDNLEDYREFRRNA
ncbi:MAG: aldo/keto reductase [Oscillospiraceae bacterium]|jgi:predicted aldo/keto reductase-like oxidoreductase|nr:aldo/keto reductase [Oscillospiraceae bacterium]